jgi:uncharacterized protein YukE
MSLLIFANNAGIWERPSHWTENWDMSDMNFIFGEPKPCYQGQYYRYRAIGDFDMMILMSDYPAPIAFPPNLNSTPILAYGQNLLRFIQGLQLNADAVSDVTNLALQSWQGEAANAFETQMSMRVIDLSQVSQALGDVPNALIHYGETISWAQSAHADAMRTYYAAWNQLPESEPVLRQCVAIQREVIQTAQSAAERCATVLRNAALRLPIFRTCPAPTNPLAGGLGTGKYIYKSGLWTAEAFEIYLHGRHHEIEHLIKTFGRNGGQPFMRGGSSVLAWKPGANLTATEGTLAQTTARMNRIGASLNSMKVWLRGANVVGAALSGVVQTADDWNKEFTVGQRTARATASTVLEGGGAWGGFAAGAAVGGAIGTGFFGVGAIPGAIIGGVVGVAGAFLGGWIGRQAKEELFESSEEVFGGNR